MTSFCLDGFSAKWSFLCFGVCENPRLNIFSSCVLSMCCRFHAYPKRGCGLHLHLHVYRKCPRCFDVFLGFGPIPIGCVRFSIRMGWKWVGVDGKGYANTTYISEFHPHIPAGRIFQKKGLPAAAESRPPPTAALFFAE